MNNKVVIVGVILSGLIVTACSSPKPMWRKAGVVPFDMNSTLAKCRYDVRAAKVDKNEQNAMVSDCMESQGFRYTNY